MIRFPAHRTALLLALTVSVGACPGRLNRFTFTAPAMGTEFRIVLYAADSMHATEAASGAFSLADSLEAIMSDYRPDSEISRLSNSAGSGRFVGVSAPLMRVLREATDVSDATDGAFDASAGALTRLWRHGIRRGEVPPDSAIRRAVATVGFRDVRFDTTTGSVRLDRPDMRLDLGGIAKGFAADRMLERLRADGLSHALVDAGGDIAAGDAPPSSDGWRVALAGIYPDVGTVTTLVVSNAGLATSGDRFRFIESGGRRYSHIIDPKTGYGTTHTHSVTVIAPSATLADAFASAFTVMPAARAIAHAEFHPRLEARILSRTDSLSFPVLKKTSGFPIH